MSLETMQEDYKIELYEMYYDELSNEGYRGETLVLMAMDMAEEHFNNLPEADNYEEAQ